VTAAAPAPPAPPAPAASAGALAPFRHRAFATLWIATVVSNVGTWMHDVAAGWLMTTLAPSPLMVAAVQAANTLPVVMLALPAGALADIVDRRRMLVAVQAAALCLSAALGLAVLAGHATPGMLLAFTAALGACAAMTAPTWQAVVPELVPRPVVPSAIALNSVGINISRAIGPALGGAVIVGAGVAYPFLLNALTFAGVIAAVWLWRREAPARRLPPERFAPAMGTGLRYAAASPPLLRTLARSAAFFLSASAYWALLPLYAREQLGGDAALYGLMVTAIGAGAVAGAFALPALRRRAAPGAVVAGGTAATALVMAALALAPDRTAALAAMPVAGASWIAVLSTLNASAQASLPAWVRARGLALNIVVFFAGMTVGGLLWGALAERAGIPAALLAAAATLLAAMPLVRRARLEAGGADLAPSMHWPAPMVAAEPEPDRGPVTVAVSYRIAEEDRDAFLAALAELRLERRRDGAYEWSVWQDAADPDRWVETFRLASWLDHLRQHERVTKADADVQERVRAFHRGDAPPAVEHWLAP
jgi:MFS family permease